MSGALETVMPADQVVSFTITVGAEYVYLSGIPAGRKGHRYVVENFIRYVPIFCTLVLVRCLTGPDAGEQFACSPANFATRYRRAD